MNWNVRALTLESKLPTNPPQRGARKKEENRSNASDVICGCNWGREASGVGELGHAICNAGCIRERGTCRRRVAYLISARAFRLALPRDAEDFQIRMFFLVISNSTTP